MSPGEIVSEYADMLDACVEVGRVAECNRAFTRQLFAAVQNGGKAFEDLTIREALELIRSETKRFNGVPG